MSLSFFQYPCVKKLFIIYFIGLLIVLMVSNFRVIILGMFLPMYAFIMSQYFSWRISKCRKCDEVSSKKYAKFYALLSSLSMVLLPLGALLDDYKFEVSDIFWQTLTAIIIGVVMYYVLFAYFIYLIDSFREERHKKNKEKLDSN